MKNMKARRYLVLLSLFALTACSTAGHRPQLSDAEIRMKLLSSRVIVQPVSQPVMLSERTKAQATGNFLLSSLVSSAIGSTGQAANPQAFQANMEIAQTLGQQMNQALPTNSAVASGRGADAALAGRLAEYFAGMQADRATENEVAINVNARKWELGYQSYLGSSDYVLAYHFDVVASELQPEGVRVLKTSSCQGQFDRKMPLDDWRIDDYREVDSAAKDIVESCLKLILQKMALPVPESA